MLASDWVRLVHWKFAPNSSRMREWASNEAVVWSVRRGWNERIRSISQLGQIDVVVRSCLTSSFTFSVQSMIKVQRSNVQTLTHSCFYIPQKFLNERQVASTKRSKKNNRTTESPFSNRNLRRIWSILFKFSTMYIVTLGKPSIWWISPIVHVFDPFYNLHCPLPSRRRSQRRAPQSPFLATLPFHLFM